MGADATACLVMERYAEVNRVNWDERAPAHAASGCYARDRFAEDPRFLSHVIRFDLPRLGEILGLRGVHLQCHIGTDTVSLARLGADMTGLDFSPAALSEARALARRAGASVRFVEAELYAAPQKLGEAGFDFVYTGIGALCWLPSARRWAEVVAKLLKPGGWLFIREFHPMLWTLEDHPRPDGLLVVEHPYFEREEPLVFDEPGTYVETDVEFQHNLTNEWNHGLGEIITGLLDCGMQLAMLVEHDSAPNNYLVDQMEQLGEGEWRLIDRPWRVPHTYTLKAFKRR